MVKMLYLYDTVVVKARFSGIKLDYAHTSLSSLYSM